MNPRPRRVDLDVRLYDTHVGHIRVGPAGKLRFFADQAWVDGGQIPRLGFTFLRGTSQARSPSILPNWFENLLPKIDGPLRSYICKHYNVGRHDSAALLSILGGDLPGAVIVDGDSEHWEEQALSAEVEHAAGMRFSVPGMQPKLSMLRSGDTWILPGHDSHGGWYVKFAGAGLERLPQIEHTTMQWAAQASFDVPECTCISLASVADAPGHFLEYGTHAFAIERFDRTTDPSRPRIHQEDLAQALDLREGGDQYRGPQGNIDYAALARLVRDACGEAAQHEFARRLAFVVASGNSDAHMKNWSWQWLPQARKPTLSPLYDQVCVVALGGEHGWKYGVPELATDLGNAARFTDITMSAVKDFANASGTPSLAATFEEGLVQTRDAWSAVVDSAPEEMRSAIAEHWKQTPVMARLVAVG